MKFILCTGDSHTQGQGADGFGAKTPQLPKPFSAIGDGMGYTRMYSDCDCYVKLVRDYVRETTKSYDKEIFSSGDEAFVNIGEKITFNCKEADALVISFMISDSVSNASVYADGKLVRNLEFLTSCPRYGNMSVRDICINCEGVDEVSVVREKGDINVISAWAYSGDYAVINCGVGSCDAKMYTEYNMDNLLSEYSPWMFIAEGHTINDWLTGETPEEYKKHLGALIDIMLKNAEHTVFVTVSPIWGEQTRNNDMFNTAAEYERFIDKSYEVVAEKNLVVADAHKVMSEVLEGLSSDESKELLYKDGWHVNNYGHKIYANKIIEKIGGLL